MAQVKNVSIHFDAGGEMLSAASAGRVSVEAQSTPPPTPGRCGFRLLPKCKRRFHPLPPTPGEMLLLPRSRERSGSCSIHSPDAGGSDG